MVMADDRSSASAITGMTLKSAGINSVDVWPPRHDVAVERGGITEQFTTIPGLHAPDPSLMFRELDRRYAGARTVIARMDVIGRVNNCHPGEQQDYCFNCGSCPLNWPTVTDPCPITGIQVHAVSGAPVSPVWLGGRIVGTVFEDDDARYCQLKDLHPARADASPGEQAYDLFGLMEAGLIQAGMTFANVVRTWLFCDRILDWYDQLNAARDRFFTERAVYEGLVPASTGVGGRNIHGTALTGDVLAVQPKDGRRVVVQGVESPLQGPAWAYGSGFSRAAEVITSTHRRLYVSGTASIDADRHTMHEGDIDGQIARTMDVVEAILDSRGMTWHDVTRAVAYIRHQRDLTRLGAYCVANKIPPLPILVARNDICRDDLLWELEIDAITRTIPPPRDVTRAATPSG
jgi:enamine deaminase RidA (YjgF/YER057c/UK114 family)